MEASKMELFSASGYVYCQVRYLVVLLVHTVCTGSFLKFDIQSIGDLLTRARSPGHVRWIVFYPFLGQFSILFFGQFSIPFFGQFSIFYFLDSFLSCFWIEFYPFYGFLAIFSKLSEKRIEFNPKIGQKTIRK